MTANKILRNIKEDEGMTRKQFLKFCNRYSERNISTILHYLRNNYNISNKEFAISIQIEMKKILEKNKKICKK